MYNNRIVLGVRVKLDTNISIGLWYLWKVLAPKYILNDIWPIFCLILVELAQLGYFVLKHTTHTTGLRRLIASVKSPRTLLGTTSESPWDWASDVLWQFDVIHDVSSLRGELEAFFELCTIVGRIIIGKEVGYSMECVAQIMSLVSWAAAHLCYFVGACSTLQGYLARLTTGLSCWVQVSHGEGITTGLFLHGSQLGYFNDGVRVSHGEDITTGLFHACSSSKQPGYLSDHLLSHPSWCTTNHYYTIRHTTHTKLTTTPYSLHLSS